MKTVKELEKNIAEITNSISKKFPELTKYILELPQKNSDNDEVNIQNLQDYYNSLEEILKKYTHTHVDESEKDESTEFPGYPIYPASQDIFGKSKKESDLNPEDPSKKKAPNEEEGALNEKSFEEDMSGSDLDVPGSELDDQQEKIGSEDEENNYYSLGGDNHNDLEEDKA